MYLIRSFNLLRLVSSWGMEALNFFFHIICSTATFVVIQCYTTYYYVSFSLCHVVLFASFPPTLSTFYHLHMAHVATTIG